MNIEHDSWILCQSYDIPVGHRYGAQYADYDYI